MASTQEHAKELAQQLSASAEVHLEGSPDFVRVSKRWSVRANPDIAIAVIPATADDVSTAVKFANSINMPFLAKSGGHGSTATLGKVQRGMLICLEKLNDVILAQDGKSARVGGGTLAKVVIDKLWAAGKQTVTGGCETTGMMGVGLGGGHGFLQGRHGLICDQFVSFSLVMADGEQHTIDASSDLWWAMRGAGHNFGIVTEATMKVHDVVHPNWAMKKWVFTHHALEGLYSTLNEKFVRGGKQPVEILHFSAFTNVPEVDPTHSLIGLYLLQEGVDEVEERFTSAFDSLGAISSDTKSGDYTNLSDWIGMDKEGEYGQKGDMINTLYPIDLVDFPIAGIREVHDRFSDLMTSHPGLYNGSIFVLESYSMHGVQAVPPESTAFPNRQDNLLLSPALRIPSGDPELQEDANRRGREMREILYRHSGKTGGPAVYVNYANGDESLEEWYGHETWRQERLRLLKKKYDPLGKFSFYAGIPHSE